MHLADHEALAIPPCDCGLREGVRRAPELTPAIVVCSVDPQDAVLALARQVYGDGELSLDVQTDVARVLRGDRELCSVVAFEGDARDALKRYLRRKLAPQTLN